MHRRRFVTGLGAGALAGVLLSARSARGQQATPAPEAVLPPLRWELQQIVGGRTVSAPDHPQDYWLQFLPDGTIAVRADCNRGGGSYAITGSSLTISRLVSTRAACPAGSLSDKYLADLGYVVSFTIAGDTEDLLVLSLMADGGDLHFAPSLPGVTWQWVGGEADGQITERVDDPSRYTLAFDDESGLRVRADCNRGHGTAKVHGNTLALTVATTRKACGTDSLGSRFLDILDRTTTFAIKDFTLRLALGKDAGTAIFEPVLP